MKHLSVLAVLMALLITGCSTVTPLLTPYSQANIVMGTTMEVTIYRSSSSATRAAEDLAVAFEIAANIDQRMSLYKADSELVALNTRAGSGAIPVSEPLLEILRASAFYAALSDGAFDVTVQPLIDLWGFYDVRTAKVPGQREVDAVLRSVGPSRMTLNGQVQTVFLGEDSAIDLGGIAKGYAIDMALEALAARGVTAALVNLGGTVGVLGLPPGDRPWVAGLKHPRGDKLIGRVQFTEGAISTSGDYDRYFEADGERYSHLLDPRTGWPVDHMFALTVHAPTATAADALSTAAFILGPSDGLALLNRCARVSGFMVAPTRGDTLNATITAEAEDVGFAIDPNEDVVLTRSQRSAQTAECVLPLS